jgi:hypothetical protein
MATAKNAAPSTKNVDQLNVFLRGELSAVETYKFTLDNLDAATHLRTNLENCLQSHQQRVSLLRAAIAKLGGTPSHESVAWPVVVSIVEGSAEAFGEKATIAAIEEAEVLGLAEYQRDTKGLDETSRDMVQTHLLPRQLQCQHALSELKRTLH